MKIVKSPTTGILKTISISQAEHYNITNLSNLAAVSTLEDIEDIDGMIGTEIAVARHRYIESYNKTNGSPSIDKYYWSLLKAPLKHKRDFYAGVCAESLRKKHDSKVELINNILEKIDN